VLGLVNPEITASNARANAEVNFEFHLIQCEIYFNPISSQDNLQDKAMGTQENKNQFNPNGPPKNFTRLVKAIRHEKFEQIWKTIQESLPAVDHDEEQVLPAPINRIEDEQPSTLDKFIQINRVQPPAPAPAPAPEPDIDTEEEEDNVSIHSFHPPLPLSPDNEETEEEDDIPTPPVTRGIRGAELRRQLMELYDTIDNDTWYSSKDHVAFANLLTSLLPSEN
jgi:hypothetical protein